MKGYRIEITHDEIMNAVQGIAGIHDANARITANRLKVMMEVIDHFNPGAMDMYKKIMYREQCYVVHLAILRAKTNGGVDALETIQQNTESLENLKKLGKERGWMSAYHKASRDAEHFVSESEPPPTKLEIVKP